MKKGLLITSAILGAAAGAVLLLEKNRRRASTTQLNPAAPVRSQLSIRIAAPAERVWQLLADINGWPGWQPEIAYAHAAAAPARAGSHFEWSVSGMLPIHSTVTVAEPGRMLAWSGWSFGAFAVHHWHFAQHAGYTEVTTEETMEGWLISLLKPLMQPALKKGNTRWLEYLREAAEKN